MDGTIEGIYGWNEEEDRESHSEDEPKPALDSARRRLNGAIRITAPLWVISGH